MRSTEFLPYTARTEFSIYATNRIFALYGLNQILTKALYMRRTEFLQRLIATPTITRTMSSSQRTISIASNQMVSLPRVANTSALTTQMTHNSRITNLLRTALVIPTVSVQSFLYQSPTHLSQLVNTALMNLTPVATISQFATIKTRFTETTHQRLSVE